MRRIMIWFGLLLCLGLPFTQAEDEESAPLATLEPLAGVVQWLPAEGAEWQTLTEPILVAEGDQIQTGSDGWGLLTFFEGVSSEILGNTHILVTSLDLPAADGDNFSIGFDQLVGDTFNTVNVVLDQESTFEIRTPTVTASVRGTEYFVMTSPTGQAMIITEEGEVATLREWLDDSAPISVPAGQTLIMSEDGYSGELLQSLILPNLPTENLAEAEEMAPLAAAPLELPNCGDNVCNYGEGEGLLTCRADCGSIAEFPDRPRPEDAPDRFDFNEDVRACLRTGTCEEFCADPTNADTCQAFSPEAGGGYLDCNNPANGERCQAVAERIGELVPDRENRPLPEAIRPEFTPQDGDRPQLPSVDGIRENLGNRPLQNNPDGTAPEGNRPLEGNDTTRPLQGNNTTRPQGNNTIQPSQGNNTTRPLTGNNTTQPPQGNNTTQLPTGNNTVQPPTGNNTVQPPTGINTLQPPLVTDTNTQPPAPPPDGGNNLLPPPPPPGD